MTNVLSLIQKQQAELETKNIGVEERKKATLSGKWTERKYKQREIGVTNSFCLNRKQRSINLLNGNLKQNGIVILNLKSSKVRV